LQATKQRLGLADDERDNLRRTEKTMPVNDSDDAVVAFRLMEGTNLR